MSAATMTAATVSRWMMGRNVSASSPFPTPLSLIHISRTGKIRALQESAALFSFLQANGIQSMQQLHEKISDMNTRYYDLRREIVKVERRIAVLNERGEMWAQYNEYKTVHKQLARVKPEKRELFEQRHSRELILYDAAARYLKEQMCIRDRP